jgi:DNA-binding MarR family transcriptional regulator
MDTQSLENLTPVQMQIYSLLSKYKVTHDGNSPTVREIAHKLHMSSTAIHHQLDNLERYGLIKRIGMNRSRGIRLIGGKYVPPFWEG